MTLKLTLHRKWFDAIAAGTKREEYREDKPFWRSRLLGRRYNFVEFRNGYSADRPWMRVECLGIDHRGDHFAIRLGKILEIRNHG